MSELDMGNLERLLRRSIINNASIAGRVLLIMVMNKGEITPEIFVTYVGLHSEIIYGYQGLKVRSITIEDIRNLFKRFNQRRSGIRLAEYCFEGEGFIVRANDACIQSLFKINELRDLLKLSKKLSLIYEKNMGSITLRLKEIDFMPESTLSLSEILFMLHILFPACISLYFDDKNLYNITIKLVKDKGVTVANIIKLFHVIKERLLLKEDNLIVDVTSPLVKRKIPISVFYKILEESYWEYISKTYLSTGKLNMLISLQDIINAINTKLRRIGYIDITLEEAFNYSREIMASEAVTEGFPRLYVGLDYFHGEYYPIPIRFYKPRHYSLEDISSRFKIPRKLIQGELK